MKIYFKDNSNKRRKSELKFANKMTEDMLDLRPKKRKIYIENN